jgi:autotransporter-associated beta strand protein
MAMNLLQQFARCFFPLRVCAMACVFAALPTVALAQTSGTWTSASGGTWNNTANWSGGAVASGSGAVADFSTLDIAGTQTVTLNTAYTLGSLSFADTTTSSSGSWVISNGGSAANTLTLAATGTPTITVSSMGSGSATIGANLAGSQGFILNATNTVNPGTLVLSGSSSVSGDIVVNSGSLLLANTSQTAYSAGTFRLANGATLRVGAANQGFNRPVVLTGGTATFGTTNTTGSDLTTRIAFNSTISGSGGLTIDSTIGFEATANNTYSGNTTITPTGWVLLRALGTGSSGAPTNGPFGTGTVTLNGGGMRQYNGSTATIYNVVNVAADTSIGSGGNASDITNFAGPMTLVGGTRTFTVVGSSMQYSGPGIGDGGNNYGLTKAGTGLLMLGGSSSYTGATTLTSGTLRLDNQNAVANSTFTHSGTGTLVFNASVSGNAFTFGGLAASSTAASVSLQNNAGTPAAITLTVGGNNATTSYAGSLTGSGGLVKTGTGMLSLSGSNTYAGTTTISQGGLTISSSAALPGYATAGRFSVASGATLGVTNGVDDAAVGAILATNNLGSGATFGFDTSAGNRTYASGIAGAINLLKTGTTMLTLSGSNTYSGTTTIRQGGLTISSSAALPGYGTAGRFSVASNATLAVTNGVDDAAVGAILATGNLASGASFAFDTSAGNRTYASGIAGAINLLKTGTNTLSLSGSNSFTGATTVASGTLALGSANALAGGGQVIFSGGAIRYAAASAPIDLATRIVSSTAAISVDTVSQTVTWAGNLASTNSGGLTKSGNGTLILSGSNSYGGTTTLADGYLVLNNASALPASTTVLFSGNSSLAIGNGVTAGAGRALTLQGSNGAGADGALTAISGGTGTWAGSVTLVGARIGYNSSSSLVVTGSIGGSSPLIVSGFGGAGSTGVENTSINTQYAVIVAGTSNAYSGGTQIARGVLKIGADNALPTSTTLDIRVSGINAVQAAGFDLNGFNQTVAALTSSGITAGSGSVTSNGSAFLTSSGSTTRTFTVNQATSGTFYGIITGNLAFTKAGAGNLTLTPTLVASATTGTTGTSTFTGDTLVSGGTLTLGNANALFGSTFDSSGAGTLSFGSITAATVGGLKNSGTLALANDSSAAVTLSVGGNNVSSTFGGRLTGAGGLAKVGSGTVTLTGATSDYSGTTTVSAGTLLLSNSAAIPGIATAGRYSVASGATLSTGTAFDDATLQAMLGTGNFAANSVLAIDTGAGNRTFSNSLSGTVALAISGGNRLTLSGSNTLGAISVNSATLTLTNTSSLLGTGAITVDGGTVEWSPPGFDSYLFNGRTITVSGSGGTFRGTLEGTQLTFGNLSGTGAVVFASGSSTLVTGGNSYSGGTIIKPGAIIAFTSDSGFGSGPVTLEGGSLRSSQGAARTVGNAVSLAGNVTFNASGDAVDNNLLFTGSMTITGGNRTVDVSMSPRAGATGIFFNGPIGDGGNALGLVKTGTSMLILGGANTYTGTTTLANGTLRLDNASALGGGGNLSFTGGTLQYTGSNTADYAARIKGSTGAIRIDPNGQSITYAGSLDATNTGGLRLGGSGTLALSGSNGFAGTTQLAAGVLALGNANALAGSGTVAFNGGSVRYVSGGAGADISGKIRGSNSAVLIDTNGENVTFASAINNTNTAGLTKNGAGTLTLSGSNTYSGNTTVNAGTLAFTTDSVWSGLSGTVAINAAVVEATETASQFFLNLPIQLGASGGTFRNTSAGYWFVPGQISGAGPLTIASGSTLMVLGGVNTNSGGVTLQAGSQVVVGNDSAGPAGSPTSGAFGTGTLTLAGGGLRSTTGAGRTVGNAVNATADTTFFSAGTNDDKSITFTGPMTLSGGNRAFTVDTTGTGSPAITFSGAIGDGGNALGLTKAGPGRMILAGVNAYTGPTVVSAGILLVNGTQAGGSLTVDGGATLGGSGLIGGAVTVNGILSPGNSPGLLTVDSLVLGGTSTSIFEIDGLTRGSQYDGVNITGASGPTYGGTLSLVFGIGSALGDNTTLDLFSFTGSTAGAFSSVTSTGFYTGTWTNNNDGSFKLEQGSQTLTFTQATGDIVVVPEPAALALAAVGIAAAGWMKRRSRMVRASHKAEP